MKRTIFILLVNLFCVLLQAQNINVKSFRMLDNDLTANTNGTYELDQNGEKAALIKVVTNQTGFSFDCGSLGVVKTMQKPSEIWVYVPRGVRRITISHPTLGVLRDYDFPVSIEGARTYEMVLTTDQVETIVKHDVGGQYLIMNVNPSSAIVKIDGVEVPVEEGVVTKLVTYGKHNYSVSDPYYKEEQGIINMGKEKQTLNVSLTPNYGLLFISTTPDHGASVYIDDNLSPAGTTPFQTSKLLKGNHNLRIKLAQYETKDTTINVIDGKSDVVIPMSPLYGTVYVTAPIGCHVYINDEDKGSNLFKGRLTEGLYKIEARKESYRPYETSIQIHKGETKSVSLSAPTPIYGILNVNSRPVGANVFVDGKLMGTTPLILNDVLIGERKVKISKDGFESITKAPNVVEDQKSDIIVALQSIRNKSKVTFSCNVHIDSLMVDGLPAKLDGVNYLTPGTHKISFFIDGHEITDNIIVPKVNKHFNLMVSRKNYYESSNNHDHPSSNSESLFYNKPEVENKVFDVVEHMPTFPGGPAALMKYLADNVKYPDDAQKNGMQGRVVVSFVVECDGSISNVKTVQSVYPSLDSEAVRVVEAMPHWIPGTENGIPTRVRYSVPVSFRLQ